MTFAAILGDTLSWLTLIGQILVLVILISFIFIKKENSYMRIVKTHGMFFAFIVALIALLGSLSYSDILGYEPCKLCWYQRIFMYPQVILLGVGLYLKDRNIALYGIILSVIGMIVAWYHYLMQLGIVPASCETVGYSVSCAKVFTMHFGYITIPLMAFTAFLMNVVFLFMYRSGQAKN